LIDKQFIRKHKGEKMTEEQFLVPTDQYLKAGIHIGTKFRTKYMEKFIYKTRPDGLSVLNVQKIDQRLRIGAKLLSFYEPQDILVVCRRENGWEAVKLFAELTGTKFFAGRYPPGLITNPNLRTFIEPKIIIATDSWPDRNSISDAMKIGVPVIALCDTNNQTNFIDLVIPCNNKGKKSIGMVLYILAREFLKHKGKLTENQELSIPIEKFMED